MTRTLHPSPPGLKAGKPPLPIGRAACRGEELAPGLPDPQTPWLGSRVTLPGIPGLTACSRHLESQLPGATHCKATSALLSR